MTIVGISVGVFVGVRVSVAVLVFVGVRVSVGVLVFVAVREGVIVRVGVSLGVSVVGVVDGPAVLRGVLVAGGVGRSWPWITVCWLSRKTIATSSVSRGAR